MSLTLPSNFSTELKRLREAVPFTQAQASEWLKTQGIKVSKRSIENYEAGANKPDPTKGRAIISALTSIQRDEPRKNPANLIYEARTRGVGAQTPALLPPLSMPGEIYDLLVLDADRVLASCGPGFILDQVTERDTYHHPLSYDLFRSLLGFDPPPGMRAIKATGSSMLPGIEDGQWVLFVPVDYITNGVRHLFQIEEEQTSDWTLSMKRLQAFAGGGIKIISDNLSVGIEDEVLVPAEKHEHDEGPGWLKHERTGARLRLHIVGRVLWPRDGDDSRETRLLSQFIERLASMGIIKT